MSTSNPDAQWLLVEKLFYHALGLAPEARAAFLKEACGDDSALYREVESLLACSDATLTDLGQPVQLAASGMVGQAQEGQRIGPYRIVRLLGRGGMGIVYLAERADDQYEQKVAIKLMNAALWGNPAMVLRFRAERQILARLEHPNIARLLHGETTPQGTAYLVMEYVDGAPLDEYCRRVQPSLRARLELFLQICDAVEYAHRYLVIHRDLKPANILVTPAGTPKLVDFGVARLLDPSQGLSAPTRPSERLLTPEYASPEQVRGGAITTGTDVFGLGLVLYEMLAGERPFQPGNADPLALAKAICEQDPKPPSDVARGTPRDLDYIVLKALRKEPAQRYATAAQFSGDIRSFLSGLPVAARTGTFRYRASKFVRRHVTAVVVGAIFILTLAAFSIGMAVLAQRADRERAASQREADFLSQMFMASTPEEAAGRTVTARDLLDRGAENIDRDLAATPEVQAAMLEKIGLAYRQLGIHDKALLFTQRAWDLKKRLYGPQRIESAETLYILAELYRDEGRFDKAEPLLRQVLAVREKALGESNDMVTETLANLSECLYLEDKNTEAESLLRKGAAICRRSGSNELFVFDDYLAEVLEREGNETEAIQLLREAIDISRRVYGPVSPDSANVLHNLGNALGGIGDYVEAEALTRQAWEIRQKVLAPGHPNRLYSLNNLTYLSVEEGNAAAAEVTSKQAMELALKVYGESHPRVATVYRNQGRVQELRRDYTAAEASYNKALAILGKLKQTEGANAASIWLNYAQLQLDRGDPAGALGNARHAVDILERVDGRDSTPVAAALIVAGLSLELGGDASSAEPLFRRALAIRRARSGPQAPATVEAQVRLAEALLGEGQAGQAEPLLREAVAYVQRPPFPLLPWQRAEAESALGDCLTALGDLKEARVLLDGKPVNHPRAWWSRIAARRLNKLREAENTFSRTH